jgi:hypothetical protein
MNNKKQFLPEKECKKLNDIFLSSKSDVHLGATMNIIAPNFTLKREK